jgi:hypothetical protein
MAFVVLWILRDKDTKKTLGGTCFCRLGMVRSQNMGRSSGEISQLGVYETRWLDYDLLLFRD